MTRDMDLIRELLLKLEALPMQPGAVATIPPGGGEIAVPGATMPLRLTITSQKSAKPASSMMRVFGLM